MKLRIGLLLLAITIFLTACGSTPGNEVEVGYMQVESINVRIAESFPVQVYARIQGWLGDGCTELGSISQNRSGNIINVEITTHRPAQATCTMALVGWEENLRLEGEFPPGDYELTVNGKSVVFSVD